mgnify:CR=1 FL=1
MIEQYLKGLKVPKDELTAIERNKLLNEGKDVDRIMCCIDSGETLAPLIGCTLPEYYFSAEKMCELEEYIYNKFHSGIIVKYPSRSNGMMVDCVNQG